jgi:hypothetical protein
VGCILGGCPGVGCVRVLGVLSPPGRLLAPSCSGLLWALCFLALGGPAMHRHYSLAHSQAQLRHSRYTVTLAQYINSRHYGTICTLVTLLILHIGTAALYVNYRLQETVTWHPLLAGPLGGGERYKFASAMLFRRLVYGSSGSSQSCLDHAAIEGANRHILALAAQPKLSHTFTARSPPTPTPPPPTTQPHPLVLSNHLL